MTDRTDIGNRLVRAIEVHHEFLARGGDDIEALLAQHENLRDLLEPMLTEETPASATDEASSEPGERRFGDFRIVGEIGRGAMGVVYEAEQVSLGRRVALKLLPPHAQPDARAVARFQREARLAASLDHPGITKVYGSGEHAGQHWFAMELVHGASLAEVLETLRVGTAEPAATAAAFFAVVARRTGGAETGRRGSRIEATVDVIVQVADALGCAHAAGVVHRDVKPGNILVRNDGSAVLTDFGIARADHAVSVTLTGDFAGTPSYASPEQLRARPDELDHRTDVFSLGATLYETLTLHKPFDAPTISEVRARIERHDPKPPSRLCPAVPRDLDAVVLKALEKRKEARYQSATEFADDLRRWREGRPVLARRTGAFVRTVRWCRRNPIAAALLATATVGLLVVTALAALASQRLEQFQAMKVERDVKLLKCALDDAPGPLPEHAEALHALVATAERVLAELPMLRRVLAELRAAATTGGTIDRRRLLTEHPAAASALQLRRDRDAIAAWMNELASVGRVSEEWQGSVRTRLGVMDERAAALEAEVAARRRFAFTDPDLEYLHDSVEDQIAELEWLAAQRLPELRSRAGRAGSAGLAPTGALAAAWAACCREAATSPRYAGLNLAPQPGLVPLGTDPDSRLLEFAHAASGKVPTRGANGHLQCDADSGIVFVLVPGAETWIGAQRVDSGAPGYDPDAQDDERPPHVVRLTPFLLAKHELGHAQWNRLAAGLGIWHQCAWYEGRDGFERKPITKVTWTDCQRLCRAHGLVLPTEAQWEHACRADTEDPWWSGPTPETLRGREHVEAPVAGRVAIDDGAANPFGFFQMGGNVQEWCSEGFIGGNWDLEPGDGRRRGAVEGENMSVRGGCYRSDASWARSSKRNTAYRLDQKEILGMRPALPLYVPR